MTTDPRTMTAPTTFAPGDVLQRGRVRYILQYNWSFARSSWSVSKMKRSWITGKWRDVFCVDDVHPHVLIMDGWTHTPGPNNPQAGEVK